MKELELVARLRDEVPLEASPAIEHAVLAAIRESRAGAGGCQGNPGTRTRAPLTSRARGRRGLRWLGPRPVLAGFLALAVCAGAGVGVAVTRHAPVSWKPQLIAWSGRPTAPWPGTGLPSFGQARTEAQFIDYVTRAAAAAPGRAPQPHEWVVLRTETAGSSKGGGGFLFGPPDERVFTLQWIRVDRCESAVLVGVPMNVAPAKTVKGKLTIIPGGCGGGLASWPSTSYPYLNSLPTEPAKLESVILAISGLGRSASAAADDAAVFTEIAFLLMDETNGTVVPPKLAATLYQVLQRLPEVHFESGTDLAGRTGLGFYMVLEGYYKLELVVNPLTYTFMGDKYVAIRAHKDVGTDGTRYIRKGQVLGWEALLASAIVQHPGQLP